MGKRVVVMWAKVVVGRWLWTGGCGQVVDMLGSGHTSVVNSVLLPSKALNYLPRCYTRLFSCSEILD
jgi:hypothetical protein